MRTYWFNALRWTAKGWILFLALCGALLAQETPKVNASLRSAEPAPGPQPVAREILPEPPRQHKFWDRKNLTLFAATAALNSADFYATRSILQHGGTELDPAARVFGRSTGGLAANFSLETVRVIGMSYFLHKTGHHKLERIASMINIGVSAAAVTYDFGQ